MFQGAKTAQEVDAWWEIVSTQPVFLDIRVRVNEELLYFNFKKKKKTALERRASFARRHFIFPPSCFFFHSVSVKSVPNRVLSVDDLW